MTTSTIRHGKDHETPFPLYQGLKMHGDARMKKQIENAHNFGLSVSYGRVMEVKLAIARAVCKCHIDNGIVLPTKLQSNVFVTYDVDNVDSHAKGNFSQDEFHGTALSATNHLSWENQGDKPEPIEWDLSDKSVPKLLESYSIGHPPELENKLHVPRNENSAKLKDHSWIAHITKVLREDKLPKNEVITWSGYNSSLMSDESVKPPAVI